MLELDDRDPSTTSDECDSLRLSYPWVRRNQHLSYGMQYGGTMSGCADNGQMILVINSASAATGGSTVSSERRDSERAEYPFVFDHEGQRYMLYCPNGRDATGFGRTVSQN